MAYSFEEHRITGGIGADARYWQSLEEGVFRLPRCSGCEAWMWPAHYRCGRCGAWEQDWPELEPVGTIYSWTRSWYAFDRTRERASSVPYVVVLAEIPHAGGARVLGALAGPEDDLRIGAPVHGTIEPPAAVSQGYPSIRWRIGVPDTAASGGVK